MEAPKPKITSENNETKFKLKDKKNDISYNLSFIQDYEIYRLN